ncbi:OLC1v1029586C1 [Oldenlandia corymbosa var. corymbosa]|uniref:OLC1v1029586C1 n=1 Tax=Oldenlandia corymbosa var. corymbosa TaxID=529605 RepID=A0AAV1CHK1_OLDCO|nr:OLC1v1029586C1 [Oldenlandia corymbosa var. corymbosa]
MDHQKGTVVICFVTTADCDSVVLKADDQEELKLPPGSTGWPLLGEILDFYSKAQKGVLEELICGREGSKKLLKLWWPSAIHKLFPKSDVKTSADRMRTISAFITTILKGNAIREYVAVFDAIIKQQLQTQWISESEQVVEVGEMARKYALNSACKIFLGLDDPEKLNELETELKVLAIGAHSTPIDFPGTALNRGVKASKKIRKEIEAVFRQKKKKIGLNVTSADDDDDDPVSGKTSSMETDYALNTLLSTDENGNELISEVDMASHLTSVLHTA